MKIIKSYKDLIFEQGGLRKAPSNSTQPPQRRTTTQTRTNTQTQTNTPPAKTKISQEDYVNKVKALDGFALYFTNIIKSLVVYDSNSMADCDGWMDDSESCYWNAIWKKIEMSGTLAVKDKFKQAIIDFKKLITDQTAPDVEHAKLVAKRAEHNFYEASRMLMKDSNKATPGDKGLTGERSETVRGMVMKAINTDDHNFRWSMYYTYSPVTPYGGGTAVNVALVQSDKIDCDF
jgi:hypothetical protein